MTDDRGPLAPTDEVTGAPGELAVVEAFVNTITYNWDDPAEEMLTGPATLGRWLSAHGLLEDEGYEPDEGDLRRAVEVREALRELLYAHHEEISPPEGALELLARESRAAPLSVVFGEDEARLVPVGAGLDAAIGALLGIVLRAMHEGTWGRLKACRDDGCRYAFYDRSRNRSGRWCDMALCGNRAKVRAYRERHGGDGA